MQFSDIETKIFDLINSTIDLLGLDLVLVKLVNEGGKTLQIIIDGKDNAKVTIDDCYKVSKAIAPVLDVEDLIDSKYLLEVSSAGVERPLVREKDYVKCVGNVILVKLQTPLDDRKKYKGKLLDFKDNNIILEVEYKNDGQTNFLNKVIPLDFVKTANVVMTEEMFRAILKG